MILAGAISGCGIQRKALTEPISQTYLSKPSKNEFGLAGSPSAPGSIEKSRTGHTASLVETHQGHRVIVLGGKSNSGFVGAVEIYLPEYGRWRLGSEIPSARSGHSSVVIEGERILLSGGEDESGVSAMSYLYDPIADTWKESSPLNKARTGHGSVVLHDGRVLVVGGRVSETPMVSTEIYSLGDSES